MAKIVLSSFGSLGDLHPFLAVGIELRERGHDVVINTLEVYREKIDLLGFEFRPLRPNVNPEDKELARKMMDLQKGSERLMREILLPNLRPMYEDLTSAVKDADLFMTSDVILPAKSAAEKTGVKWISATLAPGSFISKYDPFVPPQAQWLKHLRFLGSPFFGIIYFLVEQLVKSWLKDYRRFRRELGLDENHNPIFFGKSSGLLNLAMFSEVLGKPQPDWHQPTVQTGFCFYDGQKDLGAMPEDLEKFLAAGDAPIVFTLGSAAVMDARDFFEESAKAAKMLGKRAVLIYGVFNEKPKELDAERVGFEYAPFSKIFPRAACVVHQGGVGTTGQVLRAGVPHLIMPYSHDQPDNAARCERLGVAEIISRNNYTAQSASKKLRKVLADAGFRRKAAEISKIVQAENGTEKACDEIEKILENRIFKIK